ncbi:Unknown protein, partial [Striga hermonthica]
REPIGARNAVGINPKDSIPNLLPTRELTEADEVNRRRNDGKERSDRGIEGPSVGGEKGLEVGSSRLPNLRLLGHTVEPLFEIVPNPRKGLSLTSSTNQLTVRHSLSKVPHLSKTIQKATHTLIGMQKDVEIATKNPWQSLHALSNLTQGVPEIISPDPITLDINQGIEYGLREVGHRKLDMKHLVGIPEDPTGVITRPPKSAITGAEKPKSTSNTSTPNIPLPFPQRFAKKKIDEQYAKFSEIFTKVQINILLVDALQEMPKYAKFLKDMVSRKKKLKAYEKVNLTEECSAMIQKKMPFKRKDPGSFTIACIIGGKRFGKLLCDLGESINLMPLSIFKRLEIGTIRPTTIALQMADRSLSYPKGIVEDVLVKVKGFIFPADFVVLDMEEDKEVPLILGRPFLATGGALIDVKNGELTLRVDEESITFSIYQAMKNNNEDGEIKECKVIEVVEASFDNDIITSS